MEIINSLLSENPGYLNAIRNAQPLPKIAEASDLTSTASINGKSSSLKQLLVGLCVIGIVILLTYTYNMVKQKKRKTD